MPKRVPVKEEVERTLRLSVVIILSPMENLFREMEEELEDWAMDELDEEEEEV